MKGRRWFLKWQWTLVNVLLPSKLMKMLEKQLNITISELYKMNKFAHTHTHKNKTEYHLSRWYKSKTEESVIFWIGVILIFPPSWALWLGNPEKNLAIQLTEKTALLWALVKTPLVPLQHTCCCCCIFYTWSSRKNSYFHNPLAIWFDSVFSSGKTKAKTYL